MRPDFHAKFLAKLLANFVNRLYAIHAESVRSSHREHDCRHHAIELEAGAKLLFEISEIHIIVVGRANADRFFANIHAEQREVRH